MRIPIIRRYPGHLCGIECYEKNSSIVVLWSEQMISKRSCGSLDDLNTTISISGIEYNCVMSFRWSPIGRSLFWKDNGFRLDILFLMQTAEVSVAIKIQGCRRNDQLSLSTSVSDYGLTHMSGATKCRGKAGRRKEDGQRVSAITRSLQMYG